MFGIHGLSENTVLFQKVLKYYNRFQTQYYNTRLNGEQKYCPITYN